MSSKRQFNLIINNTMKTKVYNVIIIDESGSMMPLTDSVIKGYNDLLGEIKKTQVNNKETQDHMITLVLFDDPNNIKVINDHSDLLMSNELSRLSYKPRGCTALLDAIGSTLTPLEKIVDMDEDGFGMVTIITDGYENASVKYSGEDIFKLIGRLREKGWDFNFMGASENFIETAKKMNIKNASRWETTSAGTSAMFAKESHDRTIKSNIMCSLAMDDDFIELPKEEKAARRKSLFDRKE